MQTLTLGNRFWTSKNIVSDPRGAGTPGWELLAYTNGYIHLFGFACVMNKAVEQTLSSQGISLIAIIALKL